MIMKRTPADLGVIRDLAEKAGAVIDRARQAALDPETHKKLRRFTLREAAQTLEVHPRKIYELLGQNDPGLPTGERTKSKRLFTLEEIHLLQARLQQLYGASQSLVAGPGELGGWTVTITIPFRPAPVRRPIA